MRTIVKWGIAAAGAALLAGCQTAPPPKVVEAAPAREEAQLPYKWTQGNAPQAHKDAVALFGPLFLKPGQYVWASNIPENGDTKVVIDTLTQLLYVYRDDKLI